MVSLKNRMSMKYTFQSIIAILILSAGFVSCDSSDKAELIDTGNVQSLQPLPKNVTDAGNAVQPQIVSSSQGLNPKHGAPGHRCDIAVGAPLNSPVANKMPVMNAIPRVSTPATAAPQQQVTVAGQKLNPKHGEPGHRCDISVGAPLNSAPVTTSTVANAAPQVVTSPAPAGLKINPKHGEPGHRCDIAVGAPL
jgi:hypothetical protein